MTSEKRKTDLPVSEAKQTGRRGLLKKAAIGAPVFMALSHRPAFGAVCSISGFQSVNPSGVIRHNVGGCGGYSPGGWRQNGYKVGNQDGNRNQWLLAGCRPNPRSGHTDPTQDNYDGLGTLFIDVFGGAPAISGDSSQTLHDVLDYSGSLEFHAIANYLNASYFPNFAVSPFDVVGLYWAEVNDHTEYTTEGGTTISMDGFDVKGFFAQLYH